VIINFFALTASNNCPGYSKTHPVIVWFWEVVEAYSNELKLRLLQVRLMHFTSISEVI